jgi:hypothetical protein
VCWASTHRITSNPGFESMRWPMVRMTSAVSRTGQGGCHCFTKASIITLIRQGWWLMEQYLS